MTCQEFVGFLMAYLENELPEDRLRIFREHMVECPPCEVYLDQYADSIRMGKIACSPSADDPPPDAPEELIQAILAASRGSS